MEAPRVGRVGEAHRPQGIHDARGPEDPALRRYRVPLPPREPGPHLAHVPSGSGVPLDLRHAGGACLGALARRDHHDAVGDGHAGAASRPHGQVQQLPGLQHRHKVHANHGNRAEEEGGGVEGDRRQAAGRHLLDGGLRRTVPGEDVAALGDPRQPRQADLPAADALRGVGALAQRAPGGRDAGVHEGARAKGDSAREHGEGVRKAPPDANDARSLPLPDLRHAGQHGQHARAVHHGPVREGCLPASGLARDLLGGDLDDAGLRSLHAVLGARAFQPLLRPWEGQDQHVHAQPPDGPRSDPQAAAEAGDQRADPRGGQRRGYPVLPLRGQGG
mmetsp:Transcript_45255/g.119556  ORF Transcript_45255/g.119556 Transcript_45255/m.119556 type:complete len:332 (+) Transcript_45255:3879-4874(+)